MSGSGLSTEGLVTGAPATAPTTTTTLPPPPAEPVQLEATSPVGTVVIVVPTAINVVLMASENIVDNLRAQQTSSLGLPSLYKRSSRTRPTRSRWPRSSSA
jgi:hypothetical protein